MSINPIKLNGNWDEGWALDTHVISSEHVGFDIYGHEIYNTTRTEMGELVYKLKYRNYQNNIEKILNLAKPFLDNWQKLKEVNMILPVPPTKNREFQPVVEIAFSIAEHYHIPFADNILMKISSTESKGLERRDKSLDGTIVSLKKATRNHTILLVDDLYSTGATLTECVKTLKEDPLLNKIYILTMTKTR